MAYKIIIKATCGQCVKLDPEPENFVKNFVLLLMHQLVIMHLVDFIFFKGKTLLKMTLKTACTLCIAFLSFDLFAAPLVVVKQAEDAKINPQRSEIVEQKSFKSGKGVALIADLKATEPAKGAAPDLVFDISEIPPGDYTLTSYAAVDSIGEEIMRKASSKNESLFASVQIDNGIPTKRVVFVPWSAPELCRQHLGIFSIPTGSKAIKLWLPPNVRLDYLYIRTYTPPAVPEAAKNYKPKVTPPLTHPRLWVNESTLKQARANLSHPEHASDWKRIHRDAEKKVDVTFPKNAEMEYNSALENNINARAFIYLMTGDEKHGREAVRLMCEYISRVSFGNMLDITRQIGVAIYTAAKVYDWCHPLCTPQQLEILRVNMQRLAREMECGWPPFRNSMVNGHGNEAMINRDLLSMAIALYDVDPLPYQCVSYRLLEELVPMRRFEYQSPRHNQGIGYASYRFGWEMHAAWLLRRLSGRELFHPNIKNIPQYWLHMRLPDGSMLRDGDGIPDGRGRYYSYSQTAMLCYTYNGDPILKGEFERQPRRYDNSLFLLLNDPEVKADPAINSLPLTMDFGPILSSMITRTDWNMGTNANNTVVAEIKGGGYHFGNHQHADAGALQLYYRGIQFGDLGQYKFYGTPYDLNFNKRSIAHSMMLVVDPAEKFLKTEGNDGGARFLQAHPRTPAQVAKESVWHYGRKLSCGFGPSVKTPTFSYYSADLTSAYSGKIKSFIRSYCFLNLESAQHPACIIVLDEVRSAQADFKKYWQINPLQPPLRTPEGIQMHSSANSVTGRVDLCMLRPARGEWEIDIKSGDDVYDIFGFKVTPPPSPHPEGKGHRVLFTPKQAREHDTFLALLRLHDDGIKPLEYTLKEEQNHITIGIADRIVCLKRHGKLISESFEINVPTSGKEYQVILTGMEAGKWQITTPNATHQQTCDKGNNTMHFTSRGGRCQIERATAQ